MSKISRSFIFSEPQKQCYTTPGRGKGGWGYSGMGGIKYRYNYNCSIDCLTAYFCNILSQTSIVKGACKCQTGSGQPPPLNRSLCIKHAGFQVLHMASSQRCEEPFLERPPFEMAPTFQLKVFEKGVLFF